MIPLTPTDLSLSLWHSHIHLPLCNNLALSLPLPAGDQGAERGEHHHGAEGEGRRGKGRPEKGNNLNMLSGNQRYAVRCDIDILECGRDQG